MNFTDKDVDQAAEEALQGARREVETRREMKSRQVKKTLWGEMRFYLAVDIPDDLPEENFKKYMAEYGMILNKAFDK